MEAVHKAHSSGTYATKEGKFTLNKKLVKKSIQESELVPVAFSPGRSDPMTTIKKGSKPAAEFTFIKGNTADGLYALWSTAAEEGSGSEPAVLVFSSDTNPGGSDKSSNLGTQEEALCRVSTLRLALVTLNYPIPREGIAYVPNVQAIVTPLQGRNAPTFAALCGALRQCVAGTSPSGKETQFLERKICGILDQAAIHGHVDLVLGPWGCGAFDNPVEWVADAFRRCLQLERYHGCFRRVVFAIPNAKMLKVFQKAFGAST